MSFSNKVVIITGASSGIGAATAELFAKEGADVVLVARNKARLCDVAERCQRAYKKPLIVKADVSNDDDVKTVIQQTIKTYGKIDILVNNAGFYKFGSLIKGNFIEAFDAMIKVNLRGAMQLSTLAAPYLIESKGNIVNVSSAVSKIIVDARSTPYSVSKAAMDHFTRGAALELAPSGVRVNAVNPGPVKTEILDLAGFEGTWDDFAAKTVLGRVSECEEIGELIMFLASDKAKGITGSTYLTDNGMLLKN